MQDANELYSISIHAPPRGATGWFRAPCRRCNFNSRPSARGDNQGIQPVRRGYISIHAPPRGATTNWGGKAMNKLFQFTPLREGRRSPNRNRRSSIQISIHAPPRGATEHFLQSGESGTISIHAPPRGATPMPTRSQWCRSISIHAPPRGATAKDMQFLQIFCSTLTNQHGLTIVPRNLSRLFW